MSTRSLIGIEQENKLVTGIYCHHDGYPQHMGKVLSTHYATADKVNQLIKGGDTSSINDNGESEHYGDEQSKCETSINVTAFARRARRAGAEYMYVFRSGIWKGLKIAEHIETAKVEEIEENLFDISNEKNK